MVMLHSTMGRMGIVTDAVSNIHDNWNRHFTQFPEKDLFWMCHSGGAIDTRNALASFPKDLRDRIHVLAIAPGGFIDKHLCKSILHVVSSMDPVPKMDPIGWARCRDTILVLKGSSVTDHYIQNRMYKEEIIKQYEFFKSRGAK